MKKRCFFTLLLILIIFLGACSSEDSTANQTAVEEPSESNQEKESSEENKKIPTAEDVPTSTDTKIKDVDSAKQVYVDAQWVKDVLDGKEDVGEYILAEVTWGEAADSPDYLDKHIPNATHFNTDAIEEGPIWNLKSPEDLDANCKLK